MKISNASKYILGIFAAAGILAGCSGGSQSTMTPSTGMNAIHGLRTLSHNGKLITAYRMPGGAPIAHAFKSALPSVTPDHKSKRKYAWISNFDNGTVSEFHFPKGEALTHTITGGSEPQGMCAEAKRGTFWVTMSGTEIIQEYNANSNTEIGSVDTATYGDPAGCAVSNTGTVAASIISNGDVVVYPNGTGSGTAINDGLVETFFVTFDPAGDIFADGFNSSFIPAVSEIPAGSSSGHVLTLPNSIEFPGEIQWDGTYVTVNDQEAFAIYRYSISGSTVTLEGTVSYSGAEDCDQTWIFGGHFLCADVDESNAKVYDYPAGGSAVDTWTGSFDFPIGAVVVEKPR